MLVDLLLPFEAIARVEPVSYPCSAGTLAYVYQRRTLEEFLGVEDVIDLFVLEETVGVDAGSRYVEVGSGERCLRRQRIAYVLLIVSGEVGDDCRIHSVEGTLQLCIFEHHRFERDIARSLSYAE